MILPPNLVLTSPSLTTSATANTATTGTHVAAPGANLRIRLWGYGCFPNTTGQAVVNWFLSFTSGLAGVPIGGVSSANFQGGGTWWIPGGYPLPVNTLLGFSTASALASLNLRPYTYHTIEATA